MSETWTDWHGLAAWPSHDNVVDIDWQFLACKKCDNAAGEIMINYFDGGIVWMCNSALLSVGGHLGHLARARSSSCCREAWKLDEG